MIQKHVANLNESRYNTITLLWPRSHDRAGTTHLVHSSEACHWRHNSTGVLSPRTRPTETAHVRQSRAPRCKQASTHGPKTEMLMSDVSEEFYLPQVRENETLDLPSLRQHSDSNKNIMCKGEVCKRKLLTLHKTC